MWCIYWCFFVFLFWLLMGFYNIHNDPKVLITTVAFLHQYQYRIIKKLLPLKGHWLDQALKHLHLLVVKGHRLQIKKKLSITNNLLKLYFSFSTALLCLRFGVIFEYLTMNKVYYLKLSRWYWIVTSLTSKIICWSDA